MARIVFTTFGSFGDLHPYLALAIGMKDRGHDAVVATSEVYRSKVESEGVAFAAVRPDVGELIGDHEFAKKLWDTKRGTEFLFREYVIPRQHEAYEDLYPVAENADLLITHACTYASPMVAEKRSIPWISIALQPIAFLSTWDPSVLAPAPWFRHLRLLGQRPFAYLTQLSKRFVAHWAEPIQDLRLRVGLSRLEQNPMFDGQFSPAGTLALFSEHFAKPQPDWPPHTLCTGFPFYDREEAGHTMDSGLDEFLAAGPPPVVFTLGSSAVAYAGSFFYESLAAIEKLGIRAVLLTGVFPNQPQYAVDAEKVHVAPYAPYSELLPQAIATVHQGGIGTTAQALRSGNPMLVVPWSHDQPDNAARVKRLGVARTIPKDRYRAARIERELKWILEDESYRVSSTMIGETIGEEDGIKTGCLAIERMLATGHVSDLV